MQGDKIVIALGFFDGVHLGHRALIEKTIERAKELGVTPAVISFDTHPSLMIAGEAPTPLINSPYDRAELIRRLFGIEDIIFLHFDEDMMKMTWEKFILWLKKAFNAVHLVAGYDFRFGYKGEGNVDRLREKCAELGIGTDIVPRIELEGITVSSTYIRELLSTGNVLRANQFLGHTHVLTDYVRYGYRVGRTLGIPTINQRFAEGVLVPAKGAYAVKVYMDGGKTVRPAVTNIGTRPTVSGSSVISVESHILDFDGNLYGKEVRVEFHKYLRPEKRFENTEALKQEILKNIEETRDYFNKIREIYGE